MAKKSSSLRDRSNLSWEHFGLELASSAIYRLRSEYEILVTPEHTWEEICEMLTDTKMGDIDSRREFSRPLKKLATMFLGHIELHSPMIRVDCISDVVRILRNRFPEDEISLDRPTTIRRNGQELRREEIERELLDEKEQMIYGSDGCLAHNKRARPSDMVLNVLPVPSNHMRPKLFLDSVDFSQDDITHKLMDVVRINMRLKQNRDDGAPQHILDDLAELLQYHVTTYIDNLTLGIPPASHRSGRELVTISQRIRSSEHGTKLDRIETSISRIVRSINTGETYINVYDGTYDSFVQEICLAAHDGRIWPKSEISPEVFTIDDLGDAYPMLMYRATNEGHQLLSADYDKSLESETIFAKKSSQISRIEDSGDVMNDIVDALVSDGTWKESGRSPARKLCEFVYGRLHKEQFDGDSPCLIVYENSWEDDHDSRMLNKAISILNEGAINVSIVIWHRFRNHIGDFEDMPRFQYSDPMSRIDQVNIVISELREDDAFADHQEYLDSIDEHDIAAIGPLFKDVPYKLMRRMIRSTLHRCGNLGIRNLRNYINARNDAIESSEDAVVEDDRAGGDFSSNNSSSTAATIEAFDEARRAITRIENTMSTSKSSLDDVVGLEPLITYIKNLKRRFTPEAQEFGFSKYPTGVLLTGPPGTGKTMVAKAISDEWGVPFRRVTASELVGSLVGDNEKFMQKLVEELKRRGKSGIVCFVDEAEKIFSQTRSQNYYRAADRGYDSAESILLQYMEEKLEPVFFVFTANDYQKMSPALIDRFDQTFFVDLPGKAARINMFEKMLIGEKQDPSSLDMKKLATISAGYSGRGILQCIQEAMMAAFSENRKLTENDIGSALSEATPTAESMGEQIRMMQELVAGGKMRRANRSEETADSDTSINDAMYG